jgi:uncharacterized protein (TIGR03067 family)
VLSVVLTVLTLVTGADGPQGAAQKDLDRLQGEWIMVAGRRDGVDTIVDPDKPLRCIVKGDKVSFQREGKVVEEVTIKLDPSKTPALIDSTLAGNKQVAPGIYRLEGDRFTLCYTHPGMDRPNDFSAKSGSGHTLSDWKRDKK